MGLLCWDATQIWVKHDLLVSPIHRTPAFLASYADAPHDSAVQQAASVGAPLTHNWP